MACMSAYGMWKARRANETCLIAAYGLIAADVIAAYGLIAADARTSLYACLRDVLDLKVLSQTFFV